MKNWKKLGIVTLIGAMLLMPNEVSAASVSLSDMSVKNVFLILAIVIILILLYLGYKMDSNEGIKEPKEKKSKKKEFVDSKSNYVKKQPETTYVPDEKEYEVDNVNPEEISESVEYEEDDNEDIYTEVEEPEKSLFESSNNMDETISFDTSALNKEFSDNTEEIEDVGEEFDTSIIDKIDEEDDDVGFSTAIPQSKVVVEEYEEESEEYGEEFDTSIIDQIDEEFEEEVKDVEKTVNVIDEVEETEFQGFSVGVPKSKEEPEEDFEDIEEIEPEVVVEEKPKKRYTKVTQKVTELDEDFMRQMEKNLEIGTEDGIKVTKAKKTSTRRKKAE